MARPCGHTTEHAVDRICFAWHNVAVAWEVEYTDEFEHWWNGLEEGEQVKIAAARPCSEHGPELPFPLSSSISASSHRMRELRVQVHGRPYRVLYVFDPRRVAMLLLAGDKTGDERWYD